MAMSEFLAEDGIWQFVHMRSTNLAENTSEQFARRRAAIKLQCICNCHLFELQLVNFCCFRCATTSPITVTYELCFFFTFIINMAVLLFCVIYNIVCVIFVV